MAEIRFRQAQVACTYEFINSNGVWQEKDDPAWQHLNPTDREGVWDYIIKQRSAMNGRADRRNVRIIWRGTATEPIEVDSIVEVNVLTDITYVSNEHGDDRLASLVEQLLDLVEEFRH